MPDLAVVRDDAPLRGSGPYPAGPEHVGLVVKIVSPSSRKTDRYAEAAIPLFWRVETDPSVVVHAFALQDGADVETAATSAGELLVPWGRVAVDLSRFAER